MKRFHNKRYIVILAILISSTAFVGNASARNFAKRFDDTLNGKILSGSNVLITCDSSHPQCSGAQNFTGPVYQNGPFSMVNVDTDSDSATLNSSSADISFPNNSTVVFAGLYWGGQFTDFGAPHKNFLPPNPSAKNTVKFKAPNGSYTSITGSVDEEGGFYQGFADVTNLVAGPGTYWVADAQLSTGKQMNGGWTLVIVVKTAFEPLRRVVVWDGFLKHNVGNLGIQLSDSLGARRDESSIAMNLITYDGDKGASDSLLIDNSLLIPKNNYPTLDPAAAGDISNSTIRTMGERNEDRNPSFKNTLGYDADVFELRTYVDTDRDLDLLFKTTGDIKHVGLITVQSDVEERFIQTDWSNGTSTGTSILLDSETAFLNRTGHIFHDSAPGNVRSVQFSYNYAGDLYEIMPIRSNRTDFSYIVNWLFSSNDTNKNPQPDCNQSQFWIYREVDTSSVTWMYGVNGVNHACNGSIDATYSSTGSPLYARTVDLPNNPGTIDSNWANNEISGLFLRYTDREFEVSGTMDSRVNAEHSVTIDLIGTEVPYDWSAPARWALASDFDGRLESKVFDALVPRGFGNLSFSFAQTNNSTAEVFFRTGDSETDVLSKNWEGPFDNGDALGSVTTNNKQFFQYAIETTLSDPTANQNSIESELVIEELAFDFYGIATPFTAGTWKRVEEKEEKEAPSYNIFGSEKLLEKALNKQLVPSELENHTFDETELEIEGLNIEILGDDLEGTQIEDPMASCSSTGKTTIPWFALLLVGFLFGRVRKKK